MPPRADRRRQRRASPERPDAAAEPEFTPPPLIRRTEVALVGLVGLGVVLIVLFVVLISGGGEDDGAASVTQPTASQQPTASAQPQTPGGQTPSGPDQQAMEALARRSIEALPQGQWPSLYDSFTAEFHQRCPREEFVQAGESSAQSLGTSLALLRFVRLEQIRIEGETATGIIFGKIEGQEEYSVEATFQREAGVWKLSAPAGSVGCAAFNQ